MATNERYAAIKSELGLLTAPELRELGRLRPLRASAAILGEWLGIVVGVAFYQALGNPLLYPLLVIWIGSRMLAMWVLTHDGLHGLLFRDRRVNDLVTRLLLAWPIFLSLSEFRRVHLRHHRHLKTPQDPETGLSAYPDFRFPHSRARLLSIFLLDLSGLNVVRFFLKKRLLELRGLIGKRSADSAPVHLPGLGKAAYYACLLGTLTLLGLWKEAVLFWLVPYATWYAMTLRMRLMAEHLNLPESDYFQTRSVVPNALERWLFIPHQVNYHIEHHLYPAIPAYNLVRVHQRLQEFPDFTERAPVRRGYLSMFREFLET